MRSQLRQREDSELHQTSIEHLPSVRSRPTTAADGELVPPSVCSVLEIHALHRTAIPLRSIAAGVRLRIPSSNGTVQKPPTDRFLHQRQLPVNCPPDPGGLDLTDGYSRMGPFTRRELHE